jgi:hypothetical protein
MAHRQQTLSYHLELLLETPTRFDGREFEDQKLLAVWREVTSHHSLLPCRESSTLLRQHSGSTRVSDAANPLPSVYLPFVSGCIGTVHSSAVLCAPCARTCSWRGWSNANWRVETDLSRGMYWSWLCDALPCRASRYCFYLGILNGVVHDLCRAGERRLASSSC